MDMDLQLEQKALAFVDAELDAAVERLFDALRIPSVSTDPAYADACARAARFFADELGGLGFEARVAPTGGHPMVVAHRDGPGPHLLFYGHYDVQPVDPVELWRRDPFDPAIETRADGSRYVVARGASDDKGQLRTFIEACRAWQETASRLPCRVTILLEGEEESGSANLDPFLKANRGELTADLALICDTSMWDGETPGITLALRGMAAGEVRIAGPSRDLHSGLYGGAARNPIHVLARILADLRGEDGRIALPGFYDGVEDPSPELRASWERLGFDPAAFLGEVGLSEPAGERGRPALEQLWARPTAEVNGIGGGYTGDGFKTVIPAEAFAKVSFRLVPGQDPERVWRSFEQHVRDRLPPDCSAAFTRRGDGSPAVALDAGTPELRAVRAALASEWGREPALLASGGSIPVVGSIKRLLGMDSVLVGFARDDDNIHSPNEKYELQSFHKGIRSWVRILAALAAEAPAERVPEEAA
jgi:acetylornithine deacetylase/succinyl-diaminopimelate desuccinylase-like protein